MLRAARLASALLALLAAAGSALAQGTARSQDIDTSIRAAGMGGAGVAVWWGESGVWGNPATLAGFRGLSWNWGRTRLAPGIVSNIHFTSNRLLIGGSGLGVALGRTRLDYGESEGTDPFGNPTGTFDSFEQIDGLAVGLSPLRVFEALRDLNHAREPIAPLPLDVSAGFQRKHTRLQLAPTALNSASADCLDWGVSARLAVAQLLDRDAPVRMDLSGGYAVLNANDATFDFPGESAPPSRIRRLGFALHAALSAPRNRADGSGIWSWWPEMLPDLLEFGVARDDEHISAAGSGFTSDVERWGVEVTLLGLATGRVGHVSDRASNNFGDTSGFGVGIPIGPWARLGYDWARVPQCSDCAHLIRHGATAWLDAARVWRTAVR